MHRVCLCIKDICADLFHYFKLTTLEQPHNWLFLFSGCQEPEGQRGKSTEWGGGTERESPQTWSVTLNINGILLFTPREAFLEGNCKSFWFPMKENILKEPCLCGAYSSCHRAKGRETPGTEDCSHSHSDPIENFEFAINPTSMWEANPYEQSENMQTLQRSSVSP